MGVVVSLTAAQIRFLADKGLSLEDVIAFASLLEPRSSGAERQARYRARKQGAESDVTRDVTECDTTPFPAPPNENNLTPPTHTPGYITTRARRLPVDWQPAPLPSLLQDQVSAWRSGQIESELAKFRDWAASAPGKSGLKKDWDAAWRNWLRRKIDEGPKHAKPTHKSGSVTQSAYDLAMQLTGGHP